MNFWIAAVAIVAIVMCAQTVQAVAKAKARRRLEEQEGEDFQARIDALEERIRVLERIVTEDRHDLRREISNL